MTRICLAALVLLAAVAAAAEPLPELGDQRGLCVVLGGGAAGREQVAIQVAGGGRRLVHVLALDDAGRDRVRAAVHAAGLGGVVQVERLGDGGLPYLRDLAEWVVVDDPAGLAARGVDAATIELVCAPLGTLAVRDGSTWTRRTRPRPAAYDDWAQPQHGPDGNLVSLDKAVAFPIGLRWQDGVARHFTSWASTRANIVVGGRHYVFSTCETANLGTPAAPEKRNRSFLVARSAWNGLPLWRLDCTVPNDNAALVHLNHAPLVADGGRVYTRRADGLVGVDAASGAVAVTFAVAHPPMRLALADGTLVASCWKDKAEESNPTRGGLWKTWITSSEVGAVIGFDAASGKPRWSLPVAAQQVLVADGRVYCLIQSGNPPTAQRLVAVDLATGAERWQRPGGDLAAKPEAQLLVAGSGVLCVLRPRSRSIAVLDAADGRTLWEITPANDPWVYVVDGLLWNGGRKLDPRTGTAKGAYPPAVGGNGCSASLMVGDLISSSRGSRYHDLAHPSAKGGAGALSYGGVRGSCLEGSIPANGLFYATPNQCSCAPGQVAGFAACGPGPGDPAPAAFIAPRAVERGPAFATALGAEDATGWTTHRRDAARSASVPGPLPRLTALRWRTAVAAPAPAGAPAEAWAARLRGPLAPPVAAGGVVVTVDIDRGRVIALDAASGAAKWTAQAGARIDGAPTLHRGLCLAGCQDGWLYAWRMTDGVLAWRVRLAPAERRLTAFGQVESPWPVPSAPAVIAGVVVASAGRTAESDGGIAVVGLDPATGATRWARQIGPGAMRPNDLISEFAGAAVLQGLGFAAATGEPGKGDGRTTKHGVFGYFSVPWLVAGVQGKREPALFVASGEQVEVRVDSTKLAVVGRADGKATAGWKGTWPAALARATAVAGAADGAVLAGVGKDGAGLLAPISADGAARTGVALPAIPVPDGIALADGRAYLALHDGSVVAVE